MRQYSSNPENCIYPGGYVPHRESERRIAILRTRKKKEASLKVNLKEFPDSYRMEIALPGVQREDIVLVVENNVLILDIINDDEKEKRINLPEMADVDFIAAEFRLGILQIHIPRSLVRSGRVLVMKQVVVY